MIYLYSGLPGSGKSYHVARDIRDGRIARSRVYICNFPVSVEGVFQLPASNIKVQDVMRVRSDWVAAHGEPYEGQIKLIIDEAQLVFNSRDWNTEGRRDWLTFFTQHRKLGFDVILIAQDMSMLDKQIRSLVEIECRHYKLNNFGMAGWFLSLLTFGQTFIHAMYRVASTKGNAGKIGSEYMRVKRKVYDVYDTNNLFGSDLAKSAHRQE